MGIYVYRKYHYQRPNRFDVVKTNAKNLGDTTKPTRFAIIVETNKHRPKLKDQKNVLLVSKRDLIDDNTKKLKVKADEQLKNGWIKELYGPGLKGTNKRSGVGMQLYLVKEDEVESTSQKVRGHDKRIVLNQVYNYAGKNRNQKKIVRNNRLLREIFKK